MRRILDGVYLGALIGACLAMVAIAVLVLVQVAGRIIDRVLLALGASPLTIAVPSLAEIGGFLFVCAATLALPYTLRTGGHIRVTLLSGALTGRLGHWVLVAVLVAALGLAGFAAWNSALQAWDSWAYNVVSFGMVRVPLWLPQGGMTLGLALLALAVLDELVTLLAGGQPGFRQSETSRSVENH